MYRGWAMSSHNNIYKNALPAKSYTPMKQICLPWKTNRPKSLVKHLSHFDLSSSTIIYYFSRHPYYFFCLLASFGSLKIHPLCLFLLHFLPSVTSSHFLSIFFLLCYWKSRPRSVLVSTVSTSLFIWYFDINFLISISGY